jgi:hypothetical protein
MEYTCPHCYNEIHVANPWEWLEDQHCPHCELAVYVEVDEGYEGPSFTVYKEMPGCDLYPPKQ